MMRSRGVHQRVGGIQRASVNVRPGPTPSDERERITAQQAWHVALDGIDRKRRVRGVSMAEPAALLVERTVELEVGLDAWIACECACALGQLAQIVQMRRKRDARGRVETRMVWHEVPPVCSSS